MDECGACHDGETHGRGFFIAITLHKGVKEMTIKDLVGGLHYLERLRERLEEAGYSYDELDALPESPDFIATAAHLMAGNIDVETAEERCIKLIEVYRDVRETQRRVENG